MQCEQAKRKKCEQEEKHEVVPASLLTPQSQLLSKEGPAWTNLMAPCSQLWIGLVQSRKGPDSCERPVWLTAIYNYLTVITVSSRSPVGDPQSWPLYLAEKAPPLPSPWKSLAPGEVSGAKQGRRAPPQNGTGS